MKHRKGFMALGIAVALLALLMGSYALWSKDHFFIRVSGGSMYPTLKDGQIAVFKKAPSYPRHSIVVFTMSDSWKEEWLGDDSDRLIKRVLGRPGDHLSWDGTRWYINGEFVSEVRSGACAVEPFQDKVLAPDELFVAGDVTGEKTLDSRQAFCFGLEDYLVKTSQVEEVGVLTGTIGG